MINEVINFYNLTLNDLSANLVKHNFKSYLAKQIWDWVYRKNIIDIEKMNNISKQNKEALKKILFFAKLKQIKVIQDIKQETIKFLFQLHDNNTIETVIMKFNYGWSICLSTQIGCNMGCKFCASGLQKKVRNLFPYEIILQFIMVNQWATSKQYKISNFVLMGIGEPLDNFDNVIAFLKILTDKNGLDISIRHVTISTCGICNRIISLAKIFPKINLAISLHAPNNLLRNDLMPINHTFPIETLLKTCHEYFKITKQRITFEYILIDEINDSKACAMQLVELLKGMVCLVNLIPYNETNLCNFKQSKKVKFFFKILNQYHLLATVRLKRGNDIIAACGQLRANY